MSVDDLIQAASDSSLSRFPKTGDSISAKLQREFRRGSRDEMVRDAAARRGTRPLVLREGPAVILPDGYDIHEFGGK